MAKKAGVNFEVKEKTKMKMKRDEKRLKTIEVSLEAISTERPVSLIVNQDIRL